MNRRYPPSLEDSLIKPRYSGGRDGIICAWDLNANLQTTTLSEYDAKPSTPPAPTSRQQVQAHTHWINDICLARSNEVLVSASSDISVKLWRPASTDGTLPQSIGFHSDYVKALAIPSPTSDWVASGGLDRKINLWDLSGAGRKLCIDVGEDGAESMSIKEKGSVYALAANANTIASGGPESTVRVWDTRSGKRVTRLVGHTDNIRDVMMSQDGNTIMTASSDRTIKIWSCSAGRCMYTLTMHDASVWSLFSADENLSVFYSSDRTGLIAKTDTRSVEDLGEGISVAVAQEHEGVHKIVHTGDYIWTATSRPSITCYRDVNTDHALVDVPDGYSMRRGSASTSKYPSPPPQCKPSARPRRPIPLKHLLRMSNTSRWPSPVGAAPDFAKRTSVVSRRGSKQDEALSIVSSQPVRHEAETAIEGQNGLIKYEMLNDRKRVLTLDTANEVVMWDLLKCVPIKSFGKRDIQDIKNEETTNAVVAHWCTVDTRTGSVTVTLEEQTCFDAEMYADELDLDEGTAFQEDARINLGKWVLRYLFSGLIAEEIKRDAVFREQLLGTLDENKRLQREGAPGSIQLPQQHMDGWEAVDPQSASTLRAANGNYPPATPGYTIRVATPGPGQPTSPVKGEPVRSTMPGATENGSSLPQQYTVPSQSKQAPSRNSDYFSASQGVTHDVPAASSGEAKMAFAGEANASGPVSSTSAGDNGASQKGTPTKEAGLFGKKFSMRGMKLGSIGKKGRTQAIDKEKKAPAGEKEESTENHPRSSQASNSRVIDDNILGTVQKIRFGYEDSLQRQARGQQAHENGLPVPAVAAIELPSAITPSLPAETPVLKPPPTTTVLIQEERPEAGGLADLFEGSVGEMGEMCDLIEKAGPMWLGDVLLRNQIPAKNPVKTFFVLEPASDSGLPSVAMDTRLNANRMLRARKILGYVAERVKVPSMQQEEAEGEDVAKPKPEDYLELCCANQVRPVSLQSTHVQMLTKTCAGRAALNDPRDHPSTNLA